MSSFRTRPAASRAAYSLTTDGHKAYLNAVEEAFGADIDYAMLVKLYSETPGQHGPKRKNSPSDGLRAVRPALGYGR
jgi:hypothetical protein